MAVVVTTTAAVMTVYYSSTKNRIVALRDAMSSVLKQTQEVAANVDLMLGNGVFDLDALLQRARQQACRAPFPATRRQGHSPDQRVVGIGEVGVSNNPNSVLVTYSLGSCLGVTIYDPVVRAGGLLHTMLPDSSINPEKARREPARFLDAGLPALLRGACDLKADEDRLQICVAGGAHMMDESGVFNIGHRNYRALTSILGAHGLRVRAEHIVGTESGAMMLNVATG